MLETLLRPLPAAEDLVTRGCAWASPANGRCRSRACPCPEPEDEDRVEAFDAVRLFVARGAAGRARASSPTPRPRRSSTSAARSRACRWRSSSRRRGRGCCRARRSPPSCARAPSCCAPSTRRARRATPASRSVFEQSWRAARRGRARGAGAAVGLPRRLLGRGGARGRRRRCRCSARSPTSRCCARTASACSCTRWCSSWPPCGSATTRRAPTAERPRGLFPSPAGAAAPPGRRRRPRGAARDRPRVRELPRPPGRAIAHEARPTSLAEQRADAAAVLRPPRPLRRRPRAAARRARRARVRGRIRRWPRCCGASSAIFAYRLDRYPEARRARRRALAATRRARDHDARPAMLQGRWARAACASAGSPTRGATTEQALAQAPASSDPHNAAAMLDNLALVEKSMGHYDEALRMSTESLVQHRRLGDVAGEALCLNNLTTLQHDLGDFASALANARAQPGALRAAWSGRHARLRPCQPGRVGARSSASSTTAAATRRRALELALATGNRVDRGLDSAADRADRAPRMAISRRRARRCAISPQLALAIGRPLSLRPRIACFAELLAAQGERARGASPARASPPSHPAMSASMAANEMRRGFAALATPAAATPTRPGPASSSTSWHGASSPRPGRLRRPDRRVARRADARRPPAGPARSVSRRAWNAHATHPFAQCGPRQQEPPCQTLHTLRLPARAPAPAGLTRPDRPPDRRPDRRLASPAQAPGDAADPARPRRPHPARPGLSPLGDRRPRRRDRRPGRDHLRPRPAGSPPVRLSFPAPSTTTSKASPPCTLPSPIPFPSPPSPTTSTATPGASKSSKRIRWDIDRDVIRGRQLRLRQEVPARRPVEGRASSPFLAAGRGALPVADPGPHLRQHVRPGRALHRRQDRSRSADGHWLGDQVALEALVRFTDEELKHQELFRRLERDGRRRHARGLRLRAAAERRRRRGARQVDLGGARPDLRHRALHAGALPLEHRARRRACPSCGRTCSCSTGRRSRSTRSSTSWSGGARTRGSRRAERDQGVDDLIELVGAVDGICRCRPRPTPTTSSPTPAAPFSAAEQAAVHDVVLKAYRWQYIVSGAQEPRFAEVLKALVDAGADGADRQRARADHRRTPDRRAHLPTTRTS